MVEVVRDVVAVGLAPVAEREVPYRDEELVALGTGRDVDGVAGAAVVVGRREYDVVRPVPPDGSARVFSASSPAAE